MADQLEGGAAGGRIRWRNDQLEKGPSGGRATWMAGQLVDEGGNGLGDCFGLLNALARNVDQINPETALKVLLSL